MPRKTPHPITKEDFEKLVEAMKKKLEKHYKPRAKKYTITGIRLRKYLLAINLGFGSGMRISEIIGLKLKQRYIYTNAKGEKTDKIIKSDIPPLTFDMFEFNERFIYLPVRKKGKKGRVPIPVKTFRKAGITRKDLEELLPLKKQPASIGIRSTQMFFTRLCREVLKKHSTFHQLRHGFVTHALETGLSIHEVQNFAGHSRIDTTGQYAHANPIKARDKYEEVF